MKKIILLGIVLYSYMYSSSLRSYNLKFSNQLLSFQNISIDIKVRKSRDVGYTLQDIYNVHKIFSIKNNTISNIGIPNINSLNNKGFNWSLYGQEVGLSMIRSKYFQIIDLNGKE